MVVCCVWNACLRSQAVAVAVWGVGCGGERAWMMFRKTRKAVSKVQEPGNLCKILRKSYVSLTVVLF